MENQMTFPVRLYFSVTEKQRIINHMIIFNDSISKFYQRSIRGFCRGISMFFSICLCKTKNSEAIEFLGILKNYVSKNKVYFCLKKKSNGDNFNPSLFIQLAKVKQQNERKKKPGVSEYGP